MPATVKLAGMYSSPVELPAVIVGSLAIHRPAYEYMRGPLTICKTGWAVTHVATGMNVGSRFTDHLRTRAEHIAWAKAAQEADREAWDAADRVPFGGGSTDVALAGRLGNAMRSLQS